MQPETIDAIILFLAFLVATCFVIVFAAGVAMIIGKYERMKYQRAARRRRRRD